MFSQEHKCRFNNADILKCQKSIHKNSDTYISDLLSPTYVHGNNGKDLLVKILKFSIKALASFDL